VIRQDTVFGPIFSRRLGSSLGVNLLPKKGKLCNFDCIYCECGWNKDGRGDKELASFEEVAEKLESKLLQCKNEGIPVDSITFSGDGEPTLNPFFPEVVDLTLALRDKYFPKAVVSVLSNATRISRKNVFDALRKVDNPILKLDAPTTELARKINLPAGDYQVEEIISDLKKFEGDFVLQTMFLKSDDFDSSDPVQLNAWMNIVRELRPRKVMVYTLDREAPKEGLQKFSVEQMSQMVAPLINEGFEIQIKG